MPKSLPYFRWYPSDAETDEFYASLTDQELGFYHRCLNRSWINEGLPVDPGERARAFRVTRKYLDKMWVKVGGRFVSNECVKPRLVNPRQEEEREYASRKSDGASTSATHGQSQLPGFIYLISRPSDNAVKIGSAISVPRRLAQLKYKHQEQLVLIAQYQVWNMAEVEVGLHARYKDKRINGEWFRLFGDEIKEIAITLGGDSRGDSIDHPAPRAYECVSGSEIKKEVLPPVGAGLRDTATPEQVAIRDCSERLYGKHPKAKNLVLVPGALLSASKVCSLTEIEECHAAWCEEWAKESVRFAPKLDEWLSDRGFTKWPPSHPRGRPTRKLNLYTPPAMEGGQPA